MNVRIPSSRSSPVETASSDETGKGGEEHDALLQAHGRSDDKNKSDTSQNQGNDDDEDDTIVPQDSFSFIAVHLKRQQVSVSENDAEASDGQETQRSGQAQDSTTTKMKKGCQVPEATTSLAFWLGFLVFVVESLILIFLTVDVIDRDNPNNVLGIPPDVDGSVRACQILSLLIAALTQDNIQTSLGCLYYGYNSKKLEEAGLITSRLRAAFAFLSRIILGFFSLAVTFMLVMREETARDVLLTFTAVEFVTQLDNTVFEISKWGYFGRNPQETAKHICNATVADYERGENSWVFVRELVLRDIGENLRVFVKRSILRESERQNVSKTEVSKSMGTSTQAETGGFQQTSEQELEDVEKAAADTSTDRTQSDTSVVSAMASAGSEAVRQVSTLQSKIEDDAQQEQLKPTDGPSPHSSASREESEPGSCFSIPRWCPHGKALISITTFVFTFGFLFGFWLWIAMRQGDGYYMCKRLHVQLGDDFIPELGTFSGFFDIETKPGLLGGRVEYVENKASLEYIKKNPWRFGYCHSARSWALAYNSESHPDFCRDAQISAEEDVTFDISRTAQEAWFAHLDTKDPPLTSFEMSCYDCSNMEDFCGESEGRGYCQDNKCVCKNKHSGLRCEFEEPCRSLEIDPRDDGFVGTREWSRRFYTPKGLANVSVYGRPVYFGDLRHEENTNRFDLMFFTGRRWILTDTHALRRLRDDLHNKAPKNQRETIDAVRGYFQREYHAFWSCATADFVSEAVDVNTPLDSATPVGLKWFKATVGPENGCNGFQSPERGDAVKSILLCTICSKDNRCMYNGTCNKNGKCTCTTGSTGSLCQIPPMEDGRCHEFFNMPRFEYDGGDCCESTCISGKYRCNSTFDIDMCRDPNEQCDAGSETCLKKASLDVFGDENGAKLGSSVGLSANGKVLVVGEPGANGARVFEKEGSRWRQKGKRFPAADEGVEGYEYGTSVVISNDGNVVVLAGKSDKENGRGAVLVYEWEESMNEWADFDKSLFSTCDFDDNGNDRAVLAMAMSANKLTLAFAFESSNCVDIFRRRTTDDYFSFGTKSNITFENSLEERKSLLTDAFTLSLSGDGTQLITSKQVVAVTNNQVVTERMVILSAVTDVTNGNEFDGEHGILSQSGMVLAVARSDEVVEEYETTIYSRVDGSRSGEFQNVSRIPGFPLELSADGSIIVIYRYESVSNSSSIHAFWSDTGKRLGNLTLTQSGTSSVSLSAQGTMIALGNPLLSLQDNGNARAQFSEQWQGQTSVYRLLNVSSSILPEYSLAPTASPSSATQEPTDQPSSETSRAPTDIPTISPTDLPSYNPTDYPSSRKTTRPTALRVTESPTFDNRISQPPWNQLPTVETTEPTAEPTMKPTPTVAPTPEPTMEPFPKPSPSPMTEPSLNPTYHPTLTPSKRPTINPTNQPTVPKTNAPTPQEPTTPTCGEDEVLVTVQITTDNFPHETSWVLVDTGESNRVHHCIEPCKYNRRLHTYTKTACVKTFDSCVYFQIKDLGGDGIRLGGYKLFLGDTLLFSGSSFGSLQRRSILLSGQNCAFNTLSCGSFSGFRCSLATGGGSRPGGRNDGEN